MPPLKQLSLAGVTAALTLTSLACGAAAPASAPAGGGAPAAANTAPKTGGVLTTMVASDPNDWDVRNQGKTTVNVQTHGLVYETLLRFKKGPDAEYTNQTLEPRLAEKWEVSPDGKAFTFQLRKGVKWQNVAPVNGRDLTAADVKWSLEYYSADKEFQGKKVNPSQVDFMYTGLDKVEAPDAGTVVVRFKDSYAPFPNYTASQWMPIAAHEVYDQDGSLQKRLIGTGPYMFDEQASQRGTVWVVKKNPGYWDPGKPYLDGIKKLVLPETATAQAAFQTKQLDVWVPNTTFTTARAVQQANPQASMFRFQVPIGNALLISQKKSAALQNANVRRAISLAIDREEHNKVLFGGEGKPFVAGSWPGLFTDAEVASMTKTDVEAAKKLLADAGYGSGLTLEMIITDSEETTQHQLLQSQLKRVGIDVKFTVLPREQHRPRLYRGDFDLYRNSGAGLLEADVDSFLYGEFHSTSTLNWTGINDPELDKFLTLTRTSLNPDTRRDAMRSAVKRINEQAWDPGIVHPANWAFSQAYVRNWRPHFAGGENEAFAWLDK